jgi:hypothetical protein
VVASLPSETLAAFRRIWLVAFAFRKSLGDRPTPVCCAAHELRTRRTVRQWFGAGPVSCPYDLGKDALLVAFDATDALGCHLAAGWPLPANILDLRLEFRRERNGRPTYLPDTLAGALIAHGLDAADAPCRRHVQFLAEHLKVWWFGQRRALIDLCEASTRAARKLLLAMLPRLDLARAVYRGRYIAALSRVEHTGVPLDVAGLQALQDNWLAVREGLIREIDRPYGVWRRGKFREYLWHRWAAERGLKWPRWPDGRLRLGDADFRRMAELCPEVEPVRSLKHMLDQLRDVELPVGTDGRTRCDPGGFRTITGRNAPGAGCLFLWPAWCRGLVQAPPGRGLAYLDFSQEEYLVAGALSGDRRLIADYRAGDCYLALGKSLGLIPAGGTGETHPEERRLCKTVALATLYGMRERALARRIHRPVTVAASLLRSHREAYATFWRWSDASVDFAHLHGWLRTKYGWTFCIPRGTRETTLRNWRVQATGAEVLRAAVSALDHAGITINATVHDALLIEADAGEIHAVSEEAERLMIRASAAVLGEALRVGRTVLRPGERLLADGKPRRTWERVWGLLRETQAAAEAAGV